MPIPTPQTCNWCGRGFTGSDCLGKPCQDCRAAYGLKFHGAGRDAENAKAVSVNFNRPMTDGELRQFRNWMRTLVDMMELPDVFEIEKLNII